MRPIHHALIPLAFLLAAGTGCSAGELAETQGTEKQKAPSAVPSTGPEAEAAATETAEIYVEALEEGDAAAGCSVASAEMKAALEESAAQQAGSASCAAGFTAYADRHTGVGGMEVGEVTVHPDGWADTDDGPTAHAEVVYPDGVHSEEGMKVDGFRFPYIDGAWVVDMEVS
ncbi:hypothetical protein LP52_05425 [Streptomonospora alba]|uniref:Lipoprotein n=1 Tax=Streptomonospora alba TaxID=183763 RepID=A0A0C2JS97_9ACTN|nr:hypothetical protein [Streptomonospora alba]KIH99687.1 hypothetical protein LP52_05425 [Streptomonospora alba]